MPLKPYSVLSAAARPNLPSRSSRPATAGAARTLNGAVTGKRSRTPVIWSGQPDRPFRPTARLSRQIIDRRILAKGDGGVMGKLSLLCNYTPARLKGIY